ncbi:translation elongation factor G [Desulfatibacillum aliphaticivorans]|uniref:Elongation factor G n=1 Tax=Desulfatibacillum aliphaticivorans TaxID=218208 RepID=B8FHX1_DESAL|nr:elongation factor G [Desulfatibacillum aliphaticivorans]ACL02538.1 translation elongation factor G [Desulfatibacillum aliphaticivorans]
MNEKLRNVALIAHGGAGKTSLAEAILFNAGTTNRLGRVEDGNSTMDFEPEELKRTSSISTGFATCGWKKHEFSIMDTPGDQNFFSDTRLCLQGADAAIVVIDAVDGVKVQTEQAWELADEYGLPRCIFVNRLDRERSEFLKTVKDAEESFELKPVIVQFPIGKEHEFNGVVDLLKMKAYVYDDKGNGSETDIPADIADAVEEQREAFIENVAEADDELLEKYLEGEEPSNDQLKAALKKGTLEGIFAPVLCGSATKNVAVDLLMDFLIDAMPCPYDRPAIKGYLDTADAEEVELPPDPDAPFAALIIKTMAGFAGNLSVMRVFSGSLGGDGGFYNVNRSSKERFSQLLTVFGKDTKPVTQAGPGSIVAVAKLKDTKTGDTLCDDSRKLIIKPAEIPNPLISYAVVPKAKGDEEKIFSSLTKIAEEDPALVLDRNAETKEILVRGMGQVHIENAVEKMNRKFGVSVNLNLPQVPYRETIKKKVRVQGKHKKQTGGHGQFGDCWVAFEPMERGAGFEFVDAIVGGVIPKTYIPAVEKGIVETAVKGVLAGFPTVDFKATLDFGSFHQVDSSEMAFKIAGALAFKKAIPDAGAVLLEPVYKIAVIAPDDFTGDIMGDLNSRRGRVLGMDSKGKNQVVEAHVPLSEILTYAPDLNSMTGGRGMYTMEFSHYDEVPAQLAQKIIEAAAAEKEE